MSKPISEKVLQKYNKLKSEIKARKKLLVAFSGGVDSAVLAKIAQNVLGVNAWAVYINSETIPEYELQAASKLAKELGINFEILSIEQLSDDDFTRNDINRCYFCRKKMADKLKAFAQEKGITTIAAGAQASDLDDYRPGIRAFKEENIWHPFIELDVNKDEIREIAQYLGLSVAAKPSMACLSSRINYGQRITRDNLEMVGNAEDYLRGLGFSRYRARMHDKLIRIEVPTDELSLLLKYREVIIKKLKEIGFTYITLDLEGFRTGSMNEALEL